MARQKYPLVVLALAAVGYQTSAFAQAPAPEPPAPPAPAPPAAPTPPAAPAPDAAPAPPTTEPSTPPAPEKDSPEPAPVEGVIKDDPTEDQDKPPTVFPPPVQRPPVPTRVKPQLITVGMHPAAVDFGAEADIVSSIAGEKPEPQSRRWNYKLRGFFRAPARVGIGPKAGSPEGSQVHRPPRLVGFTSADGP
jgi:hypothetical protein